MGHIFCLMGKSASGKDTLYSNLLGENELSLERIVPFTTRPIRSGEVEDREYHFTDKEGFESLVKQGKVIEHRCYHTCHGDWYYFTVDQEVFLDSKDYLIIGTLESYIKIRDYYGADKVIPLYVELDDGIRLERALKRERSQESPKYTEMCRRFLADDEDFSEEKLIAAGIDKKYINDDLYRCMDEMRDTIWTSRSTK